MKEALIIGRLDCEEGEAEVNESLNFIYKRRSIRKFSDQPVDDAIIEELLSAAMAAPTALNMQPWKFVVVGDHFLLTQLRKTTPFSNMNAPCAIVVCGCLSSIKQRLFDQYWVQDCSAATENLLLASTVLGLGSVWCGVYPSDRAKLRIRQTIELPEDVHPFALVFVGYAAEEKPARTQYDEAKVSRDRYNQPWHH